MKRPAHEVARATLNLEEVRTVGVALPTLPEQLQICSEAERMLSVVDEVASQLEADLQRAARLRQSILAEAFAGRLVPQDPTDEPATALLERLLPNGRPNRRRREEPPS